MLTLCLTYLQVMPEFVDLLLMFGEQSRPRRLYSTSFRERTALPTDILRETLNLDESSCSLEISELGWSGYEIQMCYGIKSMQRSDQSEWPFSFHDCIVNHSFDLRTIRVIWIIVETKQLIRDLVRAAITNQKPKALTSFQSGEDAFASTLATHLLITSWGLDYFDLFISFVEAKHHQLTSRVNFPSPRGQQLDNFHHLQELQILSDYVNEALLALRLNMEVMVRLRELYRDVITREYFRAGLKVDKITENYQSFQRRLKAIHSQMRFYVLNLEALAAKIEGSKTIVRYSRVCWTVCVDLV